jgi:hypothetical protein
MACFEAKRLDAVFLCLSVGGDDNAVTVSSAAHPHGAAFQLGIERNLATGEEGVSVQMQNAVVTSAHW